MRTSLPVFALMLGITLLAAPAAAQLGGSGVTSLQIDGDRAVARLDAGGFGLDLTIGFESVSGLSAQSLGLSARTLTASELVGRLPQGVQLGGGLPLLVTVEPPAAGGLTFDGMATLELHTHNLEYVAGTPLRLFRAQIGGPFVEITDAMGSGSYRTRGRTGGFSEFLILTDLRSAASVVDEKLATLADTLALHEATMPAAVEEALATRLAAVETAWSEGDEAEAIEELDTFAALVVSHSGTDVPDTWRSARDLVNVAGELRAQAASLRFSLTLAAD